ncbi:MAG TPA: hypothetical protein DCQ04_13260, partial [Actinobacteria bacterium]|nr:hypothetical protein [Actinomycetota bacterium]
MLIPGGWYADARCDGEFACIRFDSTVVETHLGLFTAPERILFPRITTVGGFKMAGQGNQTDRAIEWTQAGGWHTYAFKACGVSPVIYDATGRLLASDCGVGIGSQGFRFISPSGSLVTGDASYQPSDGIELYEWTDLGNGWRFGQGPGDG